MKMNVAAVALAALLAAPIFAQQAPPTTAPNQPPPTIRQRQGMQQHRIASGVRSGQLTAGEASRLESREARVNHEVRHDRSADGGRLTVNQRRQVDRQQNHLSRAIYRDKHNRARRMR